MNILFDVTGVLTSPEVNPWESINMRLGMTAEQDNELYEQFHAKKEISYKQWIEAVVGSWTVRGRAGIEAAGQGVSTLGPVVVETMRNLDVQGHEIGILSTLPDVIIHGLIKGLGIDTKISVYSPNRLIFDANDNVTGVDVEVDDEPTARSELVKSLGLSFDEMVVVGGSANCIGIIKAARLSFAPAGSAAAEAAAATYENLAELPGLVSQYSTRS